MLVSFQVRVSKKYVQKLLVSEFVGCLLLILRELIDNAFYTHTYTHGFLHSISKRHEKERTREREREREREGERERN